MGPRMREDMGEGGRLATPLRGRMLSGAGFIPHPETFAKLPKRIQIAVWDDSCHSQIKGFWIPAIAGMTVMQRSPSARTTGRGEVDTRRRLHEGRLFAGMTKGEGGFETCPYEVVGIMGGGEKMGPGVGEDNGGGVLGLGVEDVLGEESAA